MSTDKVAEVINKIREETSRVRFQPKVTRDPFVSLVRTDEGGSDRNDKLPRLPGFEGFTVSEIGLKGIWLGGPSNGGNQAFFTGPDGKPYRRAAGARCHNGQIIAVESDRVVMMEFQYDASGQPRPPKIVTLFVDRQDG